MPRPDKYVPRHRNAPAEPALKKSLRKSVAFSGVAVAATGLAVTGGVFAKDEAPADSAASTLASAQADRAAEPQKVEAAQVLDERSVDTSRSDRRTSLEKEKALDEESGGQVTRTEDLASQDPRDIARRLLPEYGFSESDFECLDELWVSESDWDPNADNPTSTAYGIPQALTGGTHDNLPADYETNPVSQIRWGLWYIKDSYGSPCSAWEFKQANNWY
ncbi:MAG TPA: lytic transglycosylase domain-containing protein [Nocardioidaceae bacterium]|nr:lytic transglycosylase domain-containing protein [Nocardioidaceae bacterium]